MQDCQNGNLIASSIEDATSLRILDANLNRACEGYRVAEEFARFALEDAFLARSLKEARHQLSNGFQEIAGSAAKLAFRDTRNDVGTGIETPDELRRSSTAQIAEASFKRIEQALRSLEEYGKLHSVSFARQCEGLRYGAYTLERALLGVRKLSCRLAAAKVYALLDGQSDGAQFETMARAIIAAADVVQLRDKKLGDAELLERAVRLRALTRGSECLFIVNDRSDIAALSQADGVHLGQEEIGVSSARRLLGVKAIIGVSTHTLDQLRKAVLDGANYVGCGPVFPSNTKSFESFAGLEFLREAAKETSLPSFAIGGIHLGNIDQVIEAGFSRIAIGGALNSTDESPPQIIGRLKSKLSATT